MPAEQQAGTAAMDRPPVRRVLAVGTIRNGILLMQTADTDLARVLTIAAGRR